MTSAVLVMLGWALVQVTRALPGIIWALRCPPDSGRYVFPKQGASRSERSRRAGGRVLSDGGAGEATAGAGVGGKG